MRLGIFAKTFSRSRVEEVFAAVAGHGLSCVQFNFACAGLPSLPENVPADLSLRILQAAEDHQVEIVAVSATANLIHPDPTLRREGLQRIGSIAAACKALRCPVVTLCTGTRDPDDPWRWHPQNDTSEAWADLQASLREILFLADEYDLIFALEPEIANVVNSAARARRLLDELKSPRLKLIFDPANLFHPGDLTRASEILKESLDQLGNDLALAHAKELPRLGQAAHLAVGTGALDWDLFLELLRRTGFAGPIILHGMNEAEVPASVAFLRKKGISR